MAQYWYRRTGEAAVEGPCTPEALRSLAAEGVITEQSMISADGAAWCSASEVKGLVVGIKSYTEGDPPQAGGVLASTPVSPDTVAAGIPMASTQETSPALAWGVVLTATLLTAALLVIIANRPSRSIESFTGILMWVVPGLVGALAAMIGVWRRHALAYRFGLVFGPFGGGALFLSALIAGQHLDQTIWVIVAMITLLGVITPILWTRPGVKRYFRLCCPQCGGLRIAAESMALKERRCLHCNAVFHANGRILHPGVPIPWGGLLLEPDGYPAGYPSGSAVAGQVLGPDQTAAPTAPPTRPTAPPGFAFIPGTVHGPLGRTRRLNWFIVASILILVMGLVQTSLQIVDSFHAARGTDPQNVPFASLVLACVILPAMLGMWIYWLVWVYKVHNELRHYTFYQHRISPGKALGFCFIPFFNLYWHVYMPYELARTLPWYLGRPRGTNKSGLVLTYQILSIVPGSCIPGLGLLFYGLAMREIQELLNRLWRWTAEDTGPTAGTEESPTATHPSPLGFQEPAQSSSAQVPPYLAPTSPIGDDRVARMLLPVGRSGWAIAAGYAGLFCLVIVPAPIALGLSIAAIIDLKRRPEKHGWGRTIFGLIMGLIGTVIIVAFLVMAGFAK